MIWLVEKAKGSICPAMIFYFSYNLFYNCMPIKPEFYAGNMKAYAVLSIVIFGSGIIALENYRGNERPPEVQKNLKIFLYGQSA